MSDAENLPIDEDVDSRAESRQPAMSFFGGIARKRQTIAPRLRFEVFKRDNFTCRYCGSSAPAVKIECDHVRPVSRGGRNELDNLVTACRDCNAGKGARLIEDRSAIERQLDLLPVTSRPERRDSERRELLRIQGILRNRLGDRRLDCFRLLYRWRKQGVALAAMEGAARQARDWSSFKKPASKVQKST